MLRANLFACSWSIRIDGKMVSYHKLLKQWGEGEDIDETKTWVASGTISNKNHSRSGSRSVSK